MSSEHRRAPLSTYRLQLHAGFTFDDAAALIPQLAQLGVDAIYLSPVLAHTSGSMHGYDVVDHGRVDEELGGREGLERLAAAAHERGLAVVVDIVPNHMSVAAPEDANRAWWELLERGPAASTAHWFDVDWEAGDGKVALPLLGDDADEVHRDGDVVRYHEHVLPGSDQHYRLAPWREAPTYRRFFDVTTLAGLRVEDPEVFDATHALLLELISVGVIDGLRIDHPDGLANPREYLERLAARSGGCWTVVEKIVEPGERLPAGWATAGTTGYDAMRLLDGVLVDPSGEAALTSLWERVDPRPWPQVLEQSKRQVLEQVLRPELDRLARRLPTPALEDALRELLVAMPVYRTYLELDRDPSSDDLAVLGQARAVAAQRRPDLTEDVSALVELLVTGGDDELVRLFQQTTGPVMAKAVEDTAMYRYHRLVALNEVGGDPGHWGVSLEEWHGFCTQRQERWPLALNALSTHDTKRSHDVRARLIALSELTEPWAELARQAMPRLRDLGVPDAPTGYLLLQTLLGAWPIGADRLGPYLEKATREAKERTSWTDPNPEYDEALQRSVRTVCADAELMAAVERLVTLVRPAGRRNALAALALELTMPGVPDTYQGGELEDLSLVDPDNRRPVDHGLRAQLLGRLDRMSVDEVLDGVDDGLPKLALLRAGLRLRQRRPEAFGERGSYDPLLAAGAHAERVVGFVRGGAVATIAPRWTAGFDSWADTALALPGGRWRDAVTGAEHDGGERLVGELLAGFPVAVLERS